jgi:hypothetical protein
MISSVRIPESCSKFKSYNPPGPRIWQFEKKATIALKGRFGSPVIGMNAVYVRPASWRSSTVSSMSSICSTWTLAPMWGRQRQRRQFDVAARPESHLDNRSGWSDDHRATLILVCHQHVDAVIQSLAIKRKKVDISRIKETSDILR